MKGASLFTITQKKKGSAMETCLKVVKKINEVLIMISVIFLVSSTILATINAILRKGFSQGFPWAEELSTYLIVMMVFLGLSHLELNDNNLCIGIIDNFIKEKVRNIIRIIRGILTIFLMTIMLQYGLVVLKNMYISKMITYALCVPKLYFFISMIIAFFMIIIVWLALVICKKGGKIQC